MNCEECEDIKERGLTYSCPDCENTKYEYDHDYQEMWQEIGS